MSRDCPHFPLNIPQMGIYAIVCTVDDRVYVGQSRRIRGRWKDHVHYLKAGGGSPKLQKAWEEQLSRIRGRKLSTEHKQAMSTARKGVPWTQARWKAHKLKQVAP